MRIDVMKTYKLFINGSFPRSESGRVYEVKDSKGKFLANPCLGSKKDLRESVVAARTAHHGWSSATAFNRGQVLYRVAEIMQGRIDQFVAEIIAQEEQHLLPQKLRFRAQSIPGFGMQVGATKLIQFQDLQIQSLDRTTTSQSQRVSVWLQFLLMQSLHY